MLLLGIQFSEPESSLNTYSSAHGPPNYLISRLEKSTIREVYGGDFSGTVRVHEDRGLQETHAGGGPASKSPGRVLQAVLGKEKR